MSPKKTHYKPKNSKQRSPFFYLFIFALMGALFSILSSENGLDIALLKSKKEEIPISEMLVKYKTKELKTIEIKDNIITGTIGEGKEKKQFTSVREEFATIKDLGFDNTENSTKVTIIDTSSSRLWKHFLIGIIPVILIIAFIVFISRRMSGKGDGSPFGFGKSKAKTFNGEQHNVKFTDIAGADEAKEEVVELVDFLKSPKKYKAHGAKIPTGILMVGPPGTGKTLLAKAIASEAKVPFFSVSGSEFIEMFVGVGASRVRDLFNKAKKCSPCLIFIDEIDAIGKQRGVGAHDEREQTLNQILTEMDGFDSHDTVIVIAATNRPDILDKALLRPGRFDRRVFVDMPDMAARKKIMEVHARNKKIMKNINWDSLASKTVGMSGADIESVLNEAALFSIKRHEGKKKISQIDLEDAIEKVSIGPERKTRKFTEKERQMTAYHEVGHALAGHFSGTHDPVHKISIVSRGRALGLTWFLPSEDVWSQTRQELVEKMVTLHGGRIAERLIFGVENMTTGASNDLERITEIARNMVMTYGMSNNEKLGANVFKLQVSGDNGSTKVYSEETASMIDEQVTLLIQEAENTCEKILSEHTDVLHLISKDLLKKENIYQKEFLQYFETGDSSKTKPAASTARNKIK